MLHNIFCVLYENEIGVDLLFTEFDNIVVIILSGQLFCTLYKIHL